MPQPSLDTRPSVVHRLTRRIVATVAAVALLASGCGASTPTSPPASTLSPTTSASPQESSTPPADTASPSATNVATASVVTQTQTGWGRIWDAVPPSIPTYPGAQPGQTAAGPSSTSLVVPSGNVETITAWYKASLDRLGYSTVVEPPLEDGSRVLDSTGAAPGCRVQTRVAKQGVDTTIVILYGASCPLR